MSHVKDHCKTPRKGFKRVGRLWACTCGQVWVLQWHSSMDDSWRGWRRFYKVDENASK